MTPRTRPSPFDAALAREQRAFDALDRLSALLLTHPDVDPVERVDLLLALRSFNRRSSTV